MSAHPFRPSEASPANRPEAARALPDGDEESLPAPTPRPWPPPPPSNGARERGVPSRRLALALSRASVLVAVTAATAALVVLSPVGTRRTARATAEREIDALLEPEERVLARTFASQRRPSDLWRLSHGLLVATDTRVLYVGAAPLTLLRPRDPGPRDLYVESWPYRSAFALDVDARAEGADVRIRAPSRAVPYGVESSQDAAAIARTAREARVRLRDETELLDRADRPRALPDRYLAHRVQRGETLTGLAVRYGTTVDVLRQLNGLRSDAVQAGQTLRVPEPPPAPPALDTTPVVPPPSESVPPSG